MLISLYRPDLLLSILLTFKLIRRGLLACLLTTPLIFTDCPFLFWFLSFPSGPFFLIYVSSCFAAYSVLLFLFSMQLHHHKQEALLYQKNNHRAKTD